MTGTVGTTAEAVSQPPTGPGPDYLALGDLDSFQTPPADDWNIYGKVYTTFPGEPLRTMEGSGILMFEGRPGEESLLVTRAEYGDTRMELEYMLQEGSCFSLMLQNRYEIRLCDSPYRTGSDREKPGSVHYGEDITVPPIMNASRAPGVWQKLSVEFHAPQFDGSGGKSRNARLERVRLNGETIHRSIELPRVAGRAMAQTEVAKAPVALSVESTVAFRNIGFYHEDRNIRMRNLRYAYHEENLDDDRALARATPEREASASRITAAHASSGNNFALRYTGTLEISQSGAYTFKSFARGDVTLQVDGRTVIQPTPEPDNPLYISLSDIVEGTTDLEAGSYPFTLQYKKQQRGSPSLTVLVTGPGLRQTITSEEGAWRPPVQARPMPIDPDKRAVVMRSRVDNRDKMVLNGVSVGDPEGIHYNVDVGNAALLQLWHDKFLDAGPIYTGRGMDPDTRMLAPVIIPESKISLSGRPVVAFLEDAGEAWPDSIDSSYRFLGYTNDAAGRPTFSYTLDGLEIHEKLRPGTAEHANSLTRELTLESTGPGREVWVLLADGSQIERRAEGVFSVDDTYFLEVSRESDLHHRRSNGRDELLLRIPASSQPSTFTTTFNW